MPERATAYVYDTSVNTTGSATLPKYMKAIANCGEAPAGTPIIFLPGWYKNSEVLSQYTAAINGCYDRTFWFPPNAGDDFTLLTDDDETGAYYMDFQGTTGRNCGTMNIAVAARWCLGGSGNQNYNTKPRVVVGWPNNWAAFPSTGPVNPGTPVYGTAVPVTLPTANDIAGNFLTYWGDTDRAKTIDGQYATYAPCQFWIFTCPTLGERTLRMENFGPKVTSGPLAESGAANGRLRVEVRYGLANRASLGIPYVDIDALDEEGVAVNCGSYEMVNNATVDFNGVGAMPADRKYVFTDAQAKQLADSCGAVELINNLRISFRIGGNILNNPLSKVFLDGAKIYYNSYAGASFPVGTDNTYGSTQPAKSDCDETKPGAQLIFGGESHAVVADGSLEICGGPDPDNPARRMVIGIYGVPAVESIAPTGLTRSSEGGMGENDFRDFDGLSDSAALGRMRIGEPAGRSTVSIRYDDDWFETNEGRLKVSFPALSVPSGYKIGYVDARVSWDSNNPAPGLNPIDTNSQYWQEGNGGNCKRSLPTTAEIAQAASIPANNNFTNRMFTAGGPNCLNVANSTVNPLSGGLVLTYAARGKGPCLTDCGGGGTFKDYLDGIELDVGLLPADDSQPRLIPQSGCITAHANYFAGAGTPDCALLKADSFRAQQDSPREDTNLRGNWIGRASVKGAIYAPSAAIEYDDNDVGYPLASRGIIARHLLITGAKTRQFYADPMIGGLLDRVPATRTAVFTACTKDPADPDPGQPCGQGSNDRTLTQAEVRFEVALSGPADNRIVNWVPVTTWWTDRVAG